MVIQRPESLRAGPKLCPALLSVPWKFTGTGAKRFRYSGSYVVYGYAALDLGSPKLSSRSSEKFVSKSGVV